MLLKYKHPTQEAPRQTGKEKSSVAFRQNPQLSPQDLLVTPGLTLRQWDAAAASFEAFMVDSRLDPQSCSHPTPREQLYGEALAKSFQCTLLTASNPQTNHFPPCPPLLLKCLFGESFRA